MEREERVKGRKKGENEKGKRKGGEGRRGPPKLKYLATPLLLHEVVVTWKYQQQMLTVNIIILHSHISEIGEE